MKNISININQAKISSFQVELADDMPVVSASIDLMSGAKKISSFAISSRSWATPRFEVPASMIPAILNMAQEIEKILVMQCTMALGQIEGGFQK